jgi:hypothetical protein
MRSKITSYTAKVNTKSTGLPAIGIAFWSFRVGGLQKYITLVEQRLAWKAKRHFMKLLATFD